MIVKKLTDIPSAKVEMEGVKGAFRQLALGTPDGAPNFSMRVFSLEPGGHTPYHEHAFEHVTFAIAGQGVLVDPQGDEHSFCGGDFGFVPPNEKHQFRNTSSTEVFQFICAVPSDYE